MNTFQKCLSCKREETKVTYWRREKKSSWRLHGIEDMILDHRQKASGHP
jgi:hypothetical protein